MVVRAYPITGTGQYYVRHLAEVYVEYLGPSGRGVWGGDALPHFGLTAGEPADPRPLIQLLAGNYPDGRPAVQKQRWKSRRRQAGTDCVYSVPKSLSAVFAASETRKEELSQLLLECVVQSLRDIERKVAWARRGRGGGRLEQCKIPWAVIPHDETRPPGPGHLPEPALHWHCLIPNVSVHLDGTTGAGFSHPLYETQRLASVLFDLRTSYALSTQLGLKIVPDGFSYRVEGVPEPLVSYWSSRSKQIRDRLAEVGDFTPKAAAKAARVRQPKSRVTSDERHARWLDTSRSFNFDPEVLIDATRRSRPPLSEKTQALAADGAVFAAADHLNSRQDRFTEELLTIQAGLRCIGRGVSVEALLAAVERAVTRPLEHGLAPDGEKKGVPLFKRWDAPDPPVVTRLPDEKTLHPETAAPSPPTPATAADPGITPEAGTALAPGASGDKRHPAGVNVGADSPAPLHESGNAASGGAGVHTQSPAGSPNTARPGPGPAQSTARQNQRPGAAKPNARQQHVGPGSAAPPRPERPRLVRDRIAVWLAPVSAWVLVRSGTKALASMRGGYTRDELVEFLVTARGAVPVPRASIVREVDKAIKNLDRHKLVPVGRRGREVVFTTRGQKKLELAAIRLADALSAKLGRRVKARHRRIAAALVGYAGMEDAAAFLTDRPRLRLLDARPGDEQASLLNHVARAFERSGGRVRWLSPTALGAEDLRRRTGGDATTVGAFLRGVSPLPAREVFRNLLRRPFRPVGWIAADVERLRRPLDRLTRRDVVIVDLAHLVGTRDLHALLKAVHRSRAKLILVGDTEGLSSPVAGGGWEYLTTRLPVAKVVPKVSPAHTPEAEAADLIRQRRPKAAIAALEHEGRLTFAADPADAADRLLKAYRVGGGLEDPARHLVVVGSAADAARLNRRIQRERRRAGHLGVASARVASGASVRRGDRVTFTRPSRELEVRSGERGQVTFVNPISATVWVRTDTGRTVSVPLRRFPHLNLAYTATAARSSGLDSDCRYALVRGPAFARAAVLPVLERTRDRVAVFTPLSRDALAAAFARRDEKRLALANGRQGWSPRTPPGGRQGPSHAARGPNVMPAMDPM